MGSAKDFAKALGTVMDGGKNATILDGVPGRDLRVDPRTIAEQRREIIRDELVYSLMMEPEVVHLVTKYQDLFVTFHNCYTDGEVAMSHAQLLQFCTDFQLAPVVCSANFLETAFLNARCLVEVKPPDMELEVDEYSGVEEGTSQDSQRRPRKRASTADHAGHVPHDAASHNPAEFVSNDPRKSMAGRKRSSHGGEGSPRPRLCSEGSDSSRRRNSARSTIQARKS